MKLLTLVALACFAAQSAFGLTAYERGIVQDAQKHWESAMKERAQMIQDVAQAQQAASDAATSASNAKASAATAEDKAKSAQATADQEHKNLVIAVTENTKMKPVYDRVMGPWFAPGLGAIIFGIERLGKFAIIAVAILAVIVILLVVFVPAVIPALEIAGRAVLSFLELIGAILSRGLRALAGLIFKPTPPPLPTPTPPAPAPPKPEGS